MALAQSITIYGSDLMCYHIWQWLTGSDDLGKPELLALGSEPPKEQRVLLLHLCQRTPQSLHRDEHTWGTHYTVDIVTHALLHLL